MEKNISLWLVGLYSIASILIGGVVIMINSILVKLIYGKIECSLRMELMNVIFSRRLIDIPCRKKFLINQKISIRKS